MFQVNNKFEIGAECYTYYRKPIHYKCPICEGAGKFLHNGYEIMCRNCNGSGKLHNAHQTTAEPCQVKIRTIKASKNSEDQITVRYTVTPLDPHINVKKRSEDALFAELNECEERCRQINQKEISPQF